MDTRKLWLDWMLIIITPVLDALARDELKNKMPIYQHKTSNNRHLYTYLEAFGRILLGISPWLACRFSGEEEERRKYFENIVLLSLENAFDPDKNDYMNFSNGSQPLVDAAFLAAGILRCPEVLWNNLDKKTKQNIINSLNQTRSIRPYRNNWLLFSAIIECFFHFIGEKWDSMRVDYAILKHLEWYKGDSWYGDGNDFHFDYYNSYVIHPLLVDIIREMKDEPAWKGVYNIILERAARFSTYQEHLISPDGTYPLVGRSLTYRFGAFHNLAYMALLHNLEKNITPSQVRCGLTSVIMKTVSFGSMFDDQGWLQIGVCGKQPSMGETYISTGSLYLCTTVFLPLGLPPQDDFWSSPDAPWTMKALWSGEDRQCGHAL